MEPEIYETRYGGITMDENSIQPVGSDATSGENDLQKRQEIREIPIGCITVDRWCTRWDDDPEIAELTANIKQIGMIEQPSVVANGDGMYRLIAGSRRYHACELAGYQMITCKVWNVSPEEELHITWSENKVRKDRHPAEEAELLAEMKRSEGLTDEQLGDKLGLHQSTVTERLGLLLLPEDVRRDIGTRPESPFRYSHAVELSKINRPDPAARDYEVRQILAKIRRYKLPSSEVRSLAQVICSSDYGKLPEPFRILLLENNAMTSDIARLFLRPEELVDDGDRAAAVRQEAAAWDVKEREAFVTKVIRKGWSFKQAKEACLTILTDRIDAKTRAVRKSREAVLLDTIDALMNELVTWKGVAFDDQTIRPEKLQNLYRRGKHLAEYLAQFLAAVEKG
jgi:ParB/RepB/Spo0J family partition protein